MFIGHYFDGGSWNDKNINGINRFINRFKEWMSREGTDEIDIEIFKTNVSNYTESFKFNRLFQNL
jgi:leucyl-tRNA synthetase